MSHASKSSSAPLWLALLAILPLTASCQEKTTSSRLPQDAPGVSTTPPTSSDQEVPISAGQPVDNSKSPYHIHESFLTQAWMDDFDCFTRIHGRIPTSNAELKAAGYLYFSAASPDGTPVEYVDLVDADPTATEGRIGVQIGKLGEYTELVFPPSTLAPEGHSTTFESNLPRASEFDGSAPVDRLRYTTYMSTLRALFYKAITMTGEVPTDYTAMLASLELTHELNPPSPPSLRHRTIEVGSNPELRTLQYRISDSNGKIWQMFEVYAWDAASGKLTSEWLKESQVEDKAILTAEYQPLLKANLPLPDPQQNDSKVDTATPEVATSTP